MSKATGTKASMGASGVQQHPPGSDLLRAHSTRGKNRDLQKFAVSGKLSVAKRDSFRETGLCRPAFRGGFCYLGFWVAASRERDAHAADSARSASLPDYRQLINPTGRNACADGRHPT